MALPKPMARRFACPALQSRNLVSGAAHPRMSHRRGVRFTARSGTVTTNSKPGNRVGAIESSRRETGRRARRASCGGEAFALCRNRRGIPWLGGVRRGTCCSAQLGITPLNSWPVNAIETAGNRIPSAPKWGLASGSNHEHVGSSDRLLAGFTCRSGAGSARLKERVWPQQCARPAPVRPAPYVLHRRAPTRIARRAGITAVSKVSADEEQPLNCPSRVRERVNLREGPWAPLEPSGGQSQWHMIEAVNTACCRAIRESDASCFSASHQLVGDLPCNMSGRGLGDLSQVGRTPTRRFDLP